MTLTTFFYVVRDVLVVATFLLLHFFLLRVTTDNWAVCLQSSCLFFFFKIGITLSASIPLGGLTYDAMGVKAHCVEQSFSAAMVMSLT